jgi:V8-like Glu-specific endopeptidase
MKLSIFILMSFVASAFALPVGIERPLDQRSISKAAQAYNFEGIVKLSNCSGSLIKLEGATDDSKAIVMTNGHCIQKPGGYLNPGEAWFNRPISRTMRLFNDKMELSPITATKIIYATMTKTDVALYELNETYAQIKARTGVSPLMLDETAPLAGVAIEVISGYWDRGYSCNVDGIVAKLQEGGWEWLESIRYSTPGCEIIGGTSGSPIIEAGTRTVIGINNTTNENGQRCTLNNPCEVSSTGEVRVEQGRGYGQQTALIYSCLTATRELDLSVSDCQLPKPQ